MALPAQIATVETIGQHVAIQQHPLLPGHIQRILTMIMQITSIIVPKDIEDNIMTVPENFEP